jgi:hypothetical protein
MLVTTDDYVKTQAKEALIFRTSKRAKKFWLFFCDCGKIIAYKG